MVALDKTGTITSGRMNCTSIESSTEAHQYTTGIQSEAVVAVEGQELVSASPPSSNPTVGKRLWVQGWKSGFLV